MFPTTAFRWAYDALCEECSERMADREYVQILHHAARTMESRVNDALLRLQKLGITPRLERVLNLSPGPSANRPALAPLNVNLAEYDHLLNRKEERA
jgi:hypothetical protein